MSKIGTKPATYSTIDSYEEWAKKLIQEDLTLKGKRAHDIANGIIYKEDGSIFINYTTYKKVIALFNIKAGIKLLNGYTIDLLNGLGLLYICRIGRNPNNPRLNRGESFKLRKQLKESGQLNGDNWKVFYTDDEYIRLKWYKPAVTKNILYYVFVPAGGQSNKGFRQLMSRTIIANPALKALFPFIPYKRYNGSI